MKTILVITLALLSFTAVYTQTPHQYESAKEHQIDYKDWTYKNVTTDQSINLREFTKDKKLVLVVYFAAWCGNWNYQAPFAQKLYEKYRSEGFEVIGVSEYASIDDTKKNLINHKITFPVVAESDSRTARQNTPHYVYRKSTGDNRGWGTPWNLFIEAGNIVNEGDFLVKTANIVDGELIEDEIETFIRQKLGLTEVEAKTSATCE